MATAINIRDVLNRRALVTRDSARAIKPILSAAIAGHEGELVLDFIRIAGASPSFLDETLAIIDEVMESGENSESSESVVGLVNLPTALWPFVERAGRRHGLSVKQQSDSILIISRMKEHS